jgi:hypothetical protein
MQILVLEIFFGLIVWLSDFGSFCHRVVVVKAVTKEAIDSFLNYVTILFHFLSDHKWKISKSKMFEYYIYNFV